MEAWRKISLLLCVFGVLKEFRPSEPYVTKYLINPPMNFTTEEVSNDIYPVSIYTTMASLVFVFLLTDFLRYKPVIVFDALCCVVVFIMLIVVRTLFLVQVLEVFYGLFMAGEVAYYTYIYAKVDKRHYQEVSGHTRAAYLIGRTISGIVSQILITFNLVSYYTLNYFTLVGAILATVWACFLPSVTTSLYFSREEGSNTPVEILDEEDPKTNKQCRSKLRKCAYYMWSDFYAAFSNMHIVKWMIWWSLATCGYYQVLSYVQLLWEQILKDNNIKEYTQLNGAVEAVYTLLGAVASYTCGRLKVEWRVFGECVLFIGTGTIVILLLLMSQTNSILIAYATYIIYTIIYNGMITIANSEIATYLNPDSHGLIFGFTMFVALVLQSLLTIFVSEQPRWDERDKFIIYGYYFGALAIFFGVIASVKVFRYLTGRERLMPPLPGE